MCKLVRCIAQNVVLAFMAQGHGEEPVHINSDYYFMGKLVDKLFHRSLSMRSPHWTDVDTSTCGKTSLTPHKTRPLLPQNLGKSTETSTALLQIKNLLPQQTLRKSFTRALYSPPEPISKIFPYPHVLPLTGVDRRFKTSSSVAKAADQQRTAAQNDLAAAAAEAQARAEEALEEAEAAVTAATAAASAAESDAALTQTKTEAALAAQAAADHYYNVGSHIPISYQPVCCTHIQNTMCKRLRTIATD